MASIIVSNETKGEWIKLKQYYEDRWRYKMSWDQFMVLILEDIRI